MSLTTHRSETTVDMDFRVREKAHFLASTEENGLAMFVKPAGAADHANRIIFVRYGAGIASWTIYHADGHLCLYRIEDRTEQGRESSKATVASVEDVLARIIVTTEALGPGVRRTGSRHRTGIGHTRGT